MNLLLLLSALLSALTSVAPSVRGQGPQAIAQGSICAKTVVVAAVKITTRPVAGLASLRDVAVFATSRVIAVTATPIWADRRRE